ncbi:MBL fold metallo-hydrolase [Winogradskyella wichelsiae]|uniref:MBL fold metallo-hydrolase n=1 Tax=Winogradskyella wichelsiae TaxID=2697007 RepID=UPI0015C92169|nr:MBL fold metallo-hydrolase [Winogradskyella wichelsiae]
MKTLTHILLLAIITTTFNCKNDTKKEIITTTITETNIEPTLTKSSLKIIPISHATMVLETENETIYVDPTGGSEAFEGQKTPTLVLITDIHGDHLNLETLEGIDMSKATLIAPAAVVEKLSDSIASKIITLKNDDSFNLEGINIKAIPMYNLREEALKFHTKGRGNGYLLTVNDERIYISGDTEDIPEMRNLKNIDIAFVCMNLPYTMPVESAASAVLDFKPKKVYPYHYRGTEGLSDINKFKSLVNEGNDAIEVIFLNWYE